MKLLLLIFCLFMIGCASHPPVKSGGSVWCNKPYTTGKEGDDKYFEIAKAGYIYSLASSLALKNDPAWFYPNKRLVEVHRVHRWSGMEAITFELKSHEDSAHVEEVIIAYTGSNSLKDWLFTNLPLGLAPTHYRHAREYALTIVDKYKGEDVDIVVTGASLGGGIAVNVLKHNDTTEYIDKGWVFNSSPKTKVNGTPDPRLWGASMKGEFLYPVRSAFEKIPLLTGIGVPKDHYKHGYESVKSNIAFQHFNYVLTRALLHRATYPEYINSIPNEPEAILKLSSERNCRSPEYSTSK